MHFFLLFTYHISKKVLFTSVIQTKPYTSTNKKLFKMLNEWFSSLLGMAAPLTIEMIRSTSRTG